MARTVTYLLVQSKSLKLCAQPYGRTRDSFGHFSPYIVMTQDNQKWIFVMVGSQITHRHSDMRKIGWRSEMIFSAFVLFRADARYCLFQSIPVLWSDRFH